ncbi:MAG: Gfo/Idh/MocA family oxidoreductase [Nitrospirota bacterium]
MPAYGSVSAPIGIGLIGLGRHGMRYARHLLEPLPNARLVAVCRRDVAQGAAFAADHSVRFYRDYRDLIADTAVQAVVVVTPPSLARPVCLEAVRARKPLLIEKPLAPIGPEAREMVHAAESSGIPLMTAQTLRFDAAVLALKAQLATVGPRRYLVLTTRVEPRPEVWADPTGYAGRGVLLEIGIHLLDLVRFLTGEEVVEARCEMDRPSPRSPESRALVSLRTTGDLPCIVDVSCVTGGRVSRAEWVGGDGQMIADWARHRLCSTSTRNEVEEWSVEDRPTGVATLLGFLAARERGAPMPITGLDGQRAVEIADACYESAETGRDVRLVRSVG